MRRHRRCVTECVIDGLQQVCEMIAKKWNDPEYHPELGASRVHRNFYTPTDCSHRLVSKMLPATAEKVENAFSQMRADLLCVVTGYNQSGQGDSGYHNEAAATTTIPKGSEQPRGALNNWANFLHGRQPYVLILWELTEEHQLLQSMLQRLDDIVAAADAASAPSVSRSSNVRSSPGMISMVCTAGDDELAAAVRDFAAEKTSVHIGKLWYVESRISTLVRNVVAPGCRNDR
jgi:hypothetical protein